MLQQVIANGLISSSVYLLVALAFGSSYAVLRFFDFSLAAVLVIAPYVAVLLTSWHVPIGYAILVGVTASIAAGILLHLVAFEPLRQRGCSSVELLLASLGLYVVIQNLISVMFGDDAKRLVAGLGEPIECFGARLTVLQVVLILSAASAAIGLGFLFAKSAFGLSLRAVADDSDLACIIGMDVRKTVLCAVAIGSALGGVAGVFLALDVAVTPTGGLKPLLGGIVAVVVGGSRTVRGPVLAALLIGELEHLSTLVLGSLWKDAVVFGLLIVVLLVRPRGLEAPKEVTK